MYYLCLCYVIVCGKMQDQQILLNTNLFKSRILRLCHLVKEGATLTFVGAKSITYSPLLFMGCCLCNWTIDKNESLHKLNQIWLDFLGTSWRSKPCWTYF